MQHFSSPDSPHGFRPRRSGRGAAVAVSALLLMTFALGCERAPAPAGGPGGGAGRGGPGGRAPGGDVPAVEVALRPSTTGPAVRTIEVVGTLFGDEEAQISSKVAGQVVAVLKDVGDSAAAGEPLAQIDPVAYRLLRDQAQMSLQQGLAMLGLGSVPEGDVDLTQVPTVVQKQIEYENARRRFERAAQLFSGGVAGSISEQEYTDLRSAADVARSEYDVQLLTVQSQLADVRVREAELHIRQQRLDDTTVRAPGAPTTAPSEAPPREYLVSARQVSLGEYVREGTPLFRVVADDPIKLRAGVPERFEARVRVGQPVRLLAEGQARASEGRVARVNPQIDPTSRTFQVEAVFPNPSGTLRPGQFARGAIVIGEDENVTYVPAEAVVAFAGVVRIFTVQDGKAVEHRVTTGATANGMVEVVEGYRGPGEVVIRGGSRLANGVPVKIGAPTTAPAAQEGAPPATRPG